MQISQQLGKEFEVLKYFYKNRMGHVRQIKRSVKISEHTLLKYLSKLEAIKVINHKAVGNLKIYSIDLENDLSKLLFSIFDFERLEGTEYNRKMGIKDFLEALKVIKIPYFVMLFGSTAKDNYTKESDVDMLIVYDVYNKELLDEVNKIKRRIVAERGVRINFILIKIEEFLKEKSNKINYALQDALITGYPIFGNQTYYEVIEK